MAPLFLCIGIIVGGMLFQFPGAISGGILGWLYSSLQQLKTRQDAQQQEAGLVTFETVCTPS